MTIQSRKILNKLIKHVSSAESPIEILPNCDYFEIDLDENNRCSFAPYSNEIMSIIPYLESLGYVHISDNETVFYLTYKGIHYRKIAFNEFILFVAKSVIVPIGVALATTLLTLWLKGLLLLP